MRLVVLAVALAASSGCPNDVAAACADGDPTCAPLDEGGEGPRIYVDPPFGLGFTCVTIGCDETRTLTIENRGDAALTLSLVRLAVDASTDFGVSADLPTPEARRDLGPGETMSVDVRYAPSDGLSDEGKLWIDWYDARLPYEEAPVVREELPLTARVIGNAAAATTGDVLDFGFAAVGQTVTREFVVVNDGDAVLQVGPATMDPSSAAAFTTQSSAPVFVNPGEAGRVVASFTPTLADAAFGAMIVQTNDPQRSSIAVALQGTAIAEPRLALVGGGGALSFGEVRVETERTREVVVRNLGGQPLDVTPRLVTGQGAGYAVESATGDARTTIAALGQATFVVALRPTVGGPLAGRLALASNDPTQPEETIDLDGYGAAPDAVVSSTSLDFGDVVQFWTTPAQSTSIRNGGTGELTISGVRFETGSSSQLLLASVPALPIKLSPDDPPLELSVFVQATTLGRADGVLLIETDAIGEGVQRVEVRGNVVSCAQGCPTTNGTPDCSAGRCEIDSCLPTWHDADEDTATGCECQEDRVGTQNVDIGGTCGVGLDLGTLNDTGSPEETTKTGTLHDASDVDLYFFRAKDNGEYDFNDDYKAKVELLSAPPGLQLCTRFVDSGNGCGGENVRQCGAAAYDGGGNGSGDDSQDVTVWLEWAPGANPVCGAYTIKFRANAG